MNPRYRRILGIVLGSILGLIVILVVAGIWFAQTQRFRDFVRERIITSIEDSTGGRVEISAFLFDWRHLRAEVRDFVLHGTEGPNEQPLFRTRDLTVELRFSSLIKRRKLELSSLTVEQPQANVIVYPDGRTNVPEPKIPHKSDKSALDTVVDLAIGKFSLNDGSVQFAQQKIPFSAQGENLRAQLSYENIAQRYRGELSMSPLWIQSASNPRLNVQVKLPVILGRDRIELADAVVATPASRLQISGALDHLISPNISARAAGQIDLPEVRRTLGLSMKISAAPNVPHVLYADVAFSSDDKGLRVSNAKLLLGQSSVQATGNFKNTALEQGTVQFNGNFVLAELVRILELSVDAGGVVDLNGNAIVNGTSDYTVDAAVNGRSLQFRQGDMRITNASLTSRITADPRIVRVNPLRASIAGGQIDARATLENMAHYRVDGSLSRFDLQEIATLALSKRPGYGGIISGPIHAEGDLKADRSLQASARLGITPSGRGVPVRGQINADYNQRADNVSLGQSYIALPSSRLDLSGSLGRQITIGLRSRNLNDFQPAMALASNQPPAEVPIKLDPGGVAALDATITGKLNAPLISGHVGIDRFQVQQRSFDSLAADLNAASNNVSVRNGSLKHGALDAQFQASLGLDMWKAKPSNPLTANMAIRNADVLDVLALAGQSDVPVRGGLTFSAQAGGTLGDPRGSADLAIMNGEAYGEPLDRLDARVTFGGDLITVPALHVESGMARADANATFRHPLNDFSTGDIHAHVNTNQVALGRLQTLKQKRPDLDGSVQLNLDADARLQKTSPAPSGPARTPAAPATSAFQLVSINGSAAARGLRMRGENLGDLTATAQTSGNRVSYVVNSDFAGSAIRAQGRTDLAPDYPTSATLNIRDLPIDKTLAVAGKGDLQARGLFSANGQVEGTIKDPRANLDVGLTKAMFRDQPIDRLQGHVNYSSVLVDLPSLTVEAGPNRVTLSASFRHPDQDFSSGDVRLKVDSNNLQLAQIKYLQDTKPGLSGALQLMVDGAATLNQPTQNPRISLTSLNAHVSGNGIRANGRDFGGFTLTADQAGQAVRFNIDSNLAQSTIRGSGQAQLTRDYPVNAQISFANIRYENWRGLIGSSGLGGAPGFDALVEGNVTVAGPAMIPENLTGRAEFSRMEVSTTSKTLNLGKNNTVIALRNDGPVTIVANQSGVQIQRAHWTGPSSDINVTGNVALKPAVALNVDLNANADLGLLHQFDRDISSEGKLVLNAAIRGPATQPAVNGRLELKDAAFQTVDMPNGISKANGVIVLTGNAARIDSLTAESGGGKLTASGIVVRNGQDLVLNLAARGTGVRVRLQSGASVLANADVKWTGTTLNSLLSGNATIRSVGFTPHSDFGSMLAATATPAETPAAPSGFTTGTKLDIDVRMAPGANVQTSFAQNLEAQADLNVRGTLANPGMLGRVNITQGQLIFFGTKYTVNEGNISFFNPFKIDPILNLNLETTARGVDVILTVTGPVSNMNLSYQSDPPLQFSEIVGLLAAGKMPTSDPVLVAHQPPTPPQTFQQMGESALLSQAIANPISSQLERVFGVTQLKIDPTFTSGSELPQARLTLQQQVSTNLTFTYITDLTKSDSQIIRVEWAINPQWSAVASREQNGMVGVDVFYKRRFR